MRFSKFQYLMKLHYSQTLSYCYGLYINVSVPYEITLLSNSSGKVSTSSPVSVPYEITLLSNEGGSKLAECLVSVPYEITLLSNSKMKNERIFPSFSTL